MMSLYPTAGLTLNPTYWYSIAPWSWAVCHSGSWIYQSNNMGGPGRYVWVVGKPRHHSPVRWVRSGRTIAFVPVHPYDVKDRLPVNRKNGVFAVDPKGFHLVEHVELEPGRNVELLTQPPRAFQRAFVTPLARAEEPRMVAHELKDLSVAKDITAKASLGIPITFDRKSQTFMAPQHVVQGGKSVIVEAPVGNRGGLQTRGFYGGGGVSSGGAPAAARSYGSGSESSGGSRGSGGNAGLSGARGGGGSVSASSSSAGSSSGSTGSSSPPGGSSGSSSGSSAHH